MQQTTCDYVVLFLFFFFLRRFVPWVSSVGGKCIGKIKSMHIFIVLGSQTCDSFILFVSFFIIVAEDSSDKNRSFVYVFPKRFHKVNFSLLIKCSLMK